MAVRAAVAETGLIAARADERVQRPSSLFL
jgi:hypothetical protein